MKIMKPLFFAVAFFGTFGLKAQDLTPDQFNYSYGPPAANGIITNIQYTVLNNSNSGSAPFDMTFFLFDQTTSNYWVIGTAYGGGMGGNGSANYSIPSININSTPNIPAGNNYVLELWVDYQNAVTETNENNNILVFGGVITYAPTGISSRQIDKQSVKCMPNPANDQARVDFKLTENIPVTIQLFDMNGRLVLNGADSDMMEEGEHSIILDTENLPEGIYVLKFFAGTEVVTKQLSIVHL
jgi:hypothetical protein